MEHKVLIADDSLTIQKVIKITLSNEPFALSECTDAQDLNDKVKELNPAIVLLDFNLSENKTGYDLSREIKSASPQTQILMLYGAFDSIDEGLLSDSGCSYHIVKPFDGTKFINLCRSMAQDFESNSSPSSASDDFDFSTDTPVTNEMDIPEPIENQPSDDIGDDWVVNQPDVIENDIPAPIEQSTSSSNDLDQSIEDWGMEIPAKIDDDVEDIPLDIPAPIETASMDIPDEIPADDIPAPIEDIPAPIEESAAIPPQMDGENLIPSNDDLEYPDMISSSSSDDSSTEPSDEVIAPASDDLEYPDLDSINTPEIETERPTPQLTSANDLNQVPEENIEVSQGGTETDEALANLENEIQDEMEENDLWAADEYEVPTIEVEENFVDKEVVTNTNEQDDFKSMDLDDLPQVESHNLEKVVDNTTADHIADQYQAFETDDAIEHEEVPDDFPSDVMDETTVPEPITAMQDKLQESMDRIDEAASVPENLVSEDFEKKLQLELTEKLTPIVEEYVKEYCANNIEKIAWEIIPDLAENVIKKEIQKISDSIMDS